MLNTAEKYENEELFNQNIHTNGASESLHRQHFPDSDVNIDTLTKRVTSTGGDFHMAKKP